MTTPEAKARETIDRLLKAAGWQVQSRNQLNLGAALGVAVREFPLTAGHADYLLFAGRRPIGVVEAKPEGTPLSGVEPQSDKYGAGLPATPSPWHRPLPFLYESTGVETFLTGTRDPEPRSRRVLAFHQPETFLEWARDPITLRAPLRQSILKSDFEGRLVPQDPSDEPASALLERIRAARADCRRETSDKSSPRSSRARARAEPRPASDLPGMPRPNR